jgi:hypothetical protein
MALLYYAVILIIMSPVAWHFSTRRNRTSKKNCISPTHNSSFKWTIFIKNQEQVFRDYEEDDFNKIGYRVYTKLTEPNQSYEIYILENSKKELMWINKDYESECMIGVKNPEGRRIGYLPFSRVCSI